MTLEYISNSAAWLGEPINDVRHPRSIERLWTDADLAAIGLRKRIPPPPAPIPLVDYRKQMVANAWQRAMDEADASIVLVQTSAGELPFGADATTQANLEKVLLGILAGLVPDPRPWTPKGALQPVMLTHNDLKAVAAAIGARYDALVQAYLVHKSVILQADRAALDAYNLDTGWN